MQSAQKDKFYTSPIRKLARFFEKSRDNWKAKYKRVKADRKRLQNQARRLEKSKAELTRRVEELEADVARLESCRRTMQVELEALERERQAAKIERRWPESFESKPAHHAYPVGLMLLFLQLVLTAAVSMRGAAQAIEVIATSLSWELGSPAWTTGRGWLLRVGYYKLMRAKSHATDWVWIVDFTVQIGVEKCLVILGVRLSALPPGGCTLTHEMVEPIELTPVKQAGQSVVYQCLKQAALKTGVPCEIISDHESDVKAGIEQFCGQHPETRAIYDIKHKTAALLKHALEHDPAWRDFCQHASRTKCQVQQTALAPLAPPQQKSKARYMNVDSLVEWGQATLAWMDQPPAQWAVEYDPLQVQTKLGWLTDFRANLVGWNELFQVAATTENLIRHNGLYAGVQRALEKELRGVAHTAAARGMRRDLLDFVSQEAAKAQPHERLLGSSEVVESVLGKLKRLERDQASSGFTGLILGLGALVAETTQEVVQQALETVPTKKVLAWCEKMLGRSVQAKRREVRAPPSYQEQKWDPVYRVT
jgi:hypothetical protein